MCLEVRRVLFRSALEAVGQATVPLDLRVSDAVVRASVSGRKYKLQAERGISLALFSPRAGGMGHHIGTARTSLDWSIVSKVRAGYMGRGGGREKKKKKDREKLETTDDTTRTRK
ncbi:hypothetical protein [Methylobacterium radiotolerans]|uniref:hypothetical protein n=1 Tax=Methylobacterium radiotolerans TaxID=31998 RepID=UPI001FDABDEA|nr:hypothetical protein [Methylobacterium radiotolerans]